MGTIHTKASAASDCIGTEKYYVDCFIEALRTLRRTCIHCFPSAGLGSPSVLVQPGMGPSSHQPFLPEHCATL